MVDILNNNLKRLKVVAGGFPGYGKIQVNDTRLFPYIGKDVLVLLTVSDFIVDTDGSKRIDTEEPEGV